MNNNLKFEFVRNWSGCEIWELKDSSDNPLGDIHIKKSDVFYSIYMIKVFEEINRKKYHYGTFMYEQVKSEAIRRGCKWLIGEWAESTIENKHFLDKMVTKERFRPMTEKDIKKIGFRPNKMPTYIKEI